MADCPECSAMFMPKMVESKSRLEIIAISEARQKMRQRIAPKAKMELHRFLK